MDDTNRKPHIALYISSLRKGGAERVMANLAEYLYSQGWKVTLVTTYFTPPEYILPHAGWDAETGRMREDAGELIERLYSEPAEGELPGGRIANFRVRYDKLRRIWKEKRPDLILSFIGMTNIMALLTTFGLHIPVVVSIRSTRSLEYDSRKLRILSNLTYPFAAGIVFQTPQTAASFPPAIQRKAKVLPNSINPAFMRERYEGERERAIVSVGRLDANKNPELLVRAFAGVSREFPGYRLHLYGDGPQKEKLQSLVKELGVSQRVVFEGVSDHIADKIWKAEIFVLCSNIEGMPNSLIEAMSLGLACIATDSEGGGPAMLIESGRNGYLIPVGDAHALEAKLRLLLSDGEERKRISVNAARVQEDYSPERINAAWQEYLLSIAGPVI
jgi:glycosyltransferase involved in cell wall biosynthesis